MIHGVINIYKERGFTSHDVVGKLRGILRQKKIGHTGTLDPDAEGVLPVCLGKATKLCDLLTDKEKTYRAVLLLGKTTDTQDVSGTVLSEAPVTAEEAKVREAILSFVGDYDQIPPMYSALKVNGQKLCDLARAGKEVERKPRRVTIREIRIEKIDLPRVTMEVTCSKGTYIRTLCQDIGENLGCGGCMESLLRTRVERFSLEDAIKLGEVEAIKAVSEHGPSTSGDGAETPSTLPQAIDNIARRYGLSEREHEVLELLVQGRSRAYIGERLSLASGTVGTYVSRIYEKVRVHSKQELLTIVYDEVATER